MIIRAMTTNRQALAMLILCMLGLGILLCQFATTSRFIVDVCPTPVTVRTAEEHQSIVVFPNDIFLAKSMPIIASGGGYIYMNENSWFIYGGNECGASLCPPHNNVNSSVQPEARPRAVVEMKGDVIAVFISQHYFHFVYDSILRLLPLLLHGTLERYPDATILCFGGLPNDLNLQMMAALNIQFPTTTRMVQAERNSVYRVASNSTLILTRHNDYHNKRDFQPYNFWLLDQLRARLHHTMSVHDNPQDQLFISRKGYRRGIAQEDELFATLRRRPSLVPKLKRILPDHSTVEQQAAQFAHAKLIIAPHGASLTNVIFSHWDALILIEFSPENNGFATFRNDLQVRRHYLMKCQSVPCPAGGPCADVWERQIDINVTQTVEIIASILLGNHNDREDFVIGRHEEDGEATR